jgi:hypothetical protein
VTRAGVGAALTLLALAGSFLALAAPVPAHPPQVKDEVLTRFEQFMLEGCAPCVRESVPVATLPVPSVPLPASSRGGGARATRPGEITVEALRSHVLGRPSRQSLAIGITLSVATGNPGEMYRMASGTMDEEDIGAFVSGLGDIIQAVGASTPPGAGANTVEIDQSSGSIRVGVARQNRESTVYVQAGDVRVLGRRSVWEASATLYLPVTELAALRGAITQAAAQLQKMRSRP